METILHEWHTYVTDRIARRQIRLARERALLARERALAELTRRSRALDALRLQSTRLPILTSRPHPPNNAGCRPRRRRRFWRRHSKPTVERDEPNSCEFTPRGDDKKSEGVRLPECAPQRLVIWPLYDATPCFGSA